MAERFKVVIADFVSDAAGPEREILEGCAAVEVVDAGSEDDLVGRIEDADALMVYHIIEVSRHSIERMKRSKLIVRCGVGYDNVDHVFARSRGIPVANVPDYGTEEVADTAIGMMLALTRGTHFLNSRLRAGRGDWSYTQTVPLQRLRGRIFGVVGLGRIGTAAARRAGALGMEVLFYDPFKPDGYDKALGVGRVETLEALLDQAFVVSLHCPLNDQTRHMINSDTLAGMRDGSYLINASRGAVVDATAIPGALATGKLAGAGIDVLETEPPADDDPLLLAWRDPQHPAHDRLILNPHAAFYCEQGLTEIRVKASLTCRRALLGEPIPNVVNGVEE